MSFNPWAGTFVGSQTTISADFLNNYVKVLTLYAVDGRGGDYTPTAKLRVGGTFGLEINGTGSAVRVRLAGHTVTRMGESMAGFAPAGGWTQNNKLSWTNSNPGVDVVIPVHLPDGATLNSYVVQFIGAGGHANPLTITVPSFVICRLDDTNTETVLATGTDPQTTAAGYQAAHLITATLGAAHTVDRARNRYYIRVTSESGADFQTGAVLFNHYPSYAANAHDED